MKIRELLFIIFYCVFVHSSFAQINNESPEARDFREAYSLIKWGVATNGIQFGIRPFGTGRSATKILTFLNDTNPTTIYGLWKLPPGYRFEEITLKTEEGEEIKKTVRGDALCRTPRWNLSDGKTVILNPKLLEDFDTPIDLRDCFEIKKGGTYILTIKPRLYFMKSNNEFVKLGIPEASLKVILKESDLEER